MMTLEKFAEIQDIVQEKPVAQSPAERVLVLAESLPASRPALEREALKVERLIEGLEEPASEAGQEWTGQLYDAMVALYDGIYGLLDYDECEDPELLEESLDLLQQSHSWLEDLEDLVEKNRQDIPLVA